LDHAHGGRAASDVCGVRCAGRGLSLSLADTAATLPSPAPRKNLVECLEVYLANLAVAIRAGVR